MAMRQAGILGLEGLEMSFQTLLLSLRLQAALGLSPVHLSQLNISRSAGSPSVVLGRPIGGQTDIPTQRSATPTLALLDHPPCRSAEGRSPTAHHPLLGNRAALSPPKATRSPCATAQLGFRGPCPKRHPPASPGSQIGSPPLPARPAAWLVS